VQIFDKDKVYNFMGVRHIFLAISLVLCLGSVFLLATQGLKFGIDFSGGTLIQIKYEGEAPISDIRDRLNGVEGLEGASVTEFGSKEEITIRYSSSNEELSKDVSSHMEELLSGTGNFEIRRVDVVGPKVGDELKKSGIMAVVVSLALILLYLGVRFEWRFAFAAIVSEVHDVLIVMGFISLTQIDVNLDTLAAILTVVGYSLNDTIIVFDRIREGVQESKENELKGVINESISRTLSRTMLTSLTTLASVLVLFFFAGDMLRDFSAIVAVGIVVGTASSIFIASQALVWFRFNVAKYREFLEAKKQRQREKEKMRAMYEKGIV